MSATQSVRNTPWNVPVTAAATTPPDFQGEILPGLVNCKSYSLRNGTPEEIEPYLLTSAIPAAYHWVPINGLSPADALRCVDGFIRCYRYRFATNAPPDWSTENSRIAAIILGTTRAVIMNNYDIGIADINAQESAAPVLSVVVPAETAANPNPAPTYSVLLATGTANVGILSENLGLTTEEMELVRVTMRCAQAIVPLQGLNLINDGHHYLSEKSKQAYKSFFAVEKQLWVSTYMKTLVSASGALVRDLMWHKAGHPVAISIKEAAATSPNVKLNLEAAKLGSATARLPAIEADIRAAETYLKMAESVDAIWATMGGKIVVSNLRLRVELVKSIPRTVEVLPETMNMGGGVQVTTRTGAINALKATVNKNADKVALAFGFYMAIMESTASDVGDTSSDTLRNAHSLTRLRRNNVASFVNGAELYKDYRAVRAIARQTGEILMPEMTLDA